MLPPEAPLFLVGAHRMGPSWGELFDTHSENLHDSTLLTLGLMTLHDSARLHCPNVLALAWCTSRQQAALVCFTLGLELRDRLNPPSSSSHWFLSNHQSDAAVSQFSNP